MGFWSTIRSIFQKKESDSLEKRFEDDTLTYTGNEPDCWACQMPIHNTQRSRKLQGKRMHRFCFRKIKKIALKGGGVDDFY